MVKSVLPCDLFIFCHNLITWLIPEQCHILNDTVTCSRFSVSGHDRKTWLSDTEKEKESPEQANDAATALHYHVVMHGSYSLQEFQSCIVIFS